ncbi:WD repeat and coiled-coil-containing protein-like [Gracilinanus agilis]|uniref:WD repeat and coiled-coil-containing protein-like n=1 Tax=Gracilinanus agilis TaxID=191870 RepID=UPI001CFD249C|nr:WD repeat and coiled-coil-containing protein-like [Gracilinanus agilis]
MDLGKGKLLRTGLNALYQAIHPIHGIAWTDGKQVVLTALQLQIKEPKFGDSKIIGQFEHVYGLSWGPVGAEGTPTLLAVQHKKHVTVWQVCLSSSERGKILVSQTCEIGEPFPVLPQGCVWHPKKAILTVLTSHEVSVLPSVHCDSTRVKADLVKVQGFVHCGCWTQDGQRLVVAVGSALHSFTWDDSQKSLQPCAFCPVFDMGKNICSVLATVDMQIAVATELPLDKICGLNSVESFEMPTLEEAQPSSTSSSPAAIAEESLMDTGKVSPDSERSSSSASLSSSSLDSLDLTQMLPRNYQSDTNFFFHLREKEYLARAGKESSHLVLVTFDRMVTTTRKVGVPGILVPDLLAYDPKSQVMAVASNTCHTILAYSLIPALAPGVQCIRLENCERPKGICFLSDKRLLISVGKQKFTDPTFLPSSKSDMYNIHLEVKEVDFGKEPSMTSVWSQRDFCNISLGLGMASKRKPVDSLCLNTYPQKRDLLIPGRIQCLPLGKSLIEDITGASGSQSSRPCTSPLGKPKLTSSTVISMEGLEGISGIRSSAALLPNARPILPITQYSPIREPLSFPQGRVSKTEEGEGQLCGMLERLSGSFTDLQQYLSQLIDLLLEKKQPLPLPRYPLSQDPSFLLITYQKPSSAGAVVDKRAVLLCDGKVRLQQVQQVFGLSLVEMQFGSLWILLSADSEGFVPLIFSAAQEVNIRDGSTGGPLTSTQAHS